MAVDSEPNEGSRKTLDEIRRELDAEYGFVEIHRASDLPETPDDVDPGDRATDPRPADRPVEARVFRPRPQAPRPLAPPRPIAWDDDDEVGDDRVEQLFERHQLAMGRRADDDERPRRSGYLLAALIGCAAGQALLLGFLLVTQQRLSADLFRTTLALSPRVEAPAPVTPAAPPAAAPAAAPTAAAESAPSKEQSAPPKEEVAQSIVSIPPDAEPAAATPPEPPRPVASPPPTDLPPRTVAKATTSQASRPPSASQETQTPPARRPRSRDANDVAEAQTQLRFALKEWLRTSQSTDPVIVLGPDGRTAKTYVSIASPIGFIPREQRWELDARGWNLVDDRQAGLPHAAPPPRGR